MKYLFLMFVAGCGSAEAKDPECLPARTVVELTYGPDGAFCQEDPCCPPGFEEIGAHDGAVVCLELR